MAELGELLELLHRAEVPAGPVRMEVRTLTHNARAMRAFGALRGEGGRVTFFAEATEAEPETNEAAARFWIDGGGSLIREERDGGFYAVRDGVTWWHYHPVDGGLTNQGDEHVSTGSGEDAVALLDASRFLGALRLEAAGPGERAGRPTLCSRATPRMANRDGSFDFQLHRLGSGAEEFVFEIDAEHGFLLYVESRFEGEPFRIIEVTALALGEPHPPGTFEFVVPPGEELRTTAEDLEGPPQSISVREAVARAAFPVLIPERVPPSWELDARWIEGSPRHGTGALLILHYRTPSDSEGVTITQGLGDDGLDHEAEWSDEHPFRTVERDGCEIWVRDRDQHWPQTQLRAVRDGTHVTMNSSSLSGDELVELTASLVPARPG